MFMLRLTAVIVEPGRNSSSYVERKHAAAKFTHAVLTGEEMKTRAVTGIAINRIILIKSVVFAGVTLIIAAPTDVALAQSSAVTSNIASRVLEVVIDVEGRSVSRC